MSSYYGGHDPNEDNRIIEGEYRVVGESSERSGRMKRSGGKASWIGIGAMLLWFLSKGKGLFLALKYGKFFGTALSMFAMIWSYSIFYGWRYAVGVVMMIFIHEMGHLVFAKSVGMPVSLPFFIPFVGAVITLKEKPKDAWQEAVVAIGGPLFGLVAALVALYWGIENDSGLAQALAYFGFFITLFNMIPVSPLDGGRIVTALSPWVWAVGLVIMGIATWYTFSPLMLLILLFGIYRAHQTWNLRADERQVSYFDVPAGRRWLIGIGYGLITALSAFGVFLFIG